MDIQVPDALWDGVHSPRTCILICNTALKDKVSVWQKIAYRGEDQFRTLWLDNAKQHGFPLVFKENTTTILCIHDRADNHMVTHLLSKLHTHVQRLYNANGIKLRIERKTVERARAIRPQDDGTTARIQELENLMQAEQETIEQQKEELDRLLRAQDDAQDQLETINRLEQALRRAQEQVAELQQQMQQNQADDESAASQLQTALDQTRAELRSENAEKADVQKRLQVARTVLEKLQETRNELTRKLEAERQKGEGLSQQLARQVEDNRQRTLRFQSEIKKLEQSVTEKDEQIETLSATINNINGQLNERLQQTENVKAKNERLRAQIVEKENQAEKLKARISKLQEEQSGFVKKRQELEDDIKTKERKVRQIELEKEDLVQKNARLEDEKATLENDVQSLKATLDKDSQSFSEYRDSKEKQRKVSEKIAESQRKASENIAESLTQLAESQKAQIEKLQKQVASLKQDQRNRADENNDLRRENRANASAREDAENKVEQLTFEKDNLILDRDDKTRRLADVRSSKVRLQEEVEKLKEELERLRVVATERSESDEDVENAALELTVEDLERRLESKDDDIKTLEEEITTKSDQISTLEEKVSVLEAQKSEDGSIDTLKDELTTKSAQISTLEDQLSDLKTQSKAKDNQIKEQLNLIDELNDEVVEQAADAKKEYEPEIERLNKEVEKLESELTKLNRLSDKNQLELSRIRLERDKQQQENTGLDSKNSKLQAELTSVKDQLEQERANSSESADLQAQINALTDQNKKLAAELKEREAGEAELRSQEKKKLNDAQRDQRKTQQELVLSQEQVQEQLVEIAEVESAMENMKKEIARMNELVDALQDQHADDDKAILELKQTNAALTSSKDVQEEQEALIERLESEAQKSREEVGSLRAKIQSLEQDLKDKDAVLRQGSSANTKLRAEYEKSKSECKAKLLELQQELDVKTAKYKAQREKCKAELKRCREKLEEAQSQDLQTETVPSAAATDKEVGVDELYNNTMKHIKTKCNVVLSIEGADEARFAPEVVPLLTSSGYRRGQGDVFKHVTEDFKLMYIASMPETANQSFLHSWVISTRTLKDTVSDPEKWVLLRLERSSYDEMTAAEKEEWAQFPCTADKILAATRSRGNFDYTPLNAKVSWQVFFKQKERTLPVNFDMVMHGVYRDVQQDYFLFDQEAYWQKLIILLRNVIYPDNLIFDQSQYEELMINMMVANIISEAKGKSTAVDQRNLEAFFNVVAVNVERDDISEILEYLSDRLSPGQTQNVKLLLERAKDNMDAKTVDTDDDEKVYDF